MQRTTGSFLFKLKKRVEINNTTKKKKVTRDTVKSQQRVIYYMVLTPHFAHIL